MDYVTLILGDEFDESLREALKKVLRKRGAEGGASAWAVAGSQEIEEVDAIVEGHAIRIEAETFVGLSISGPDAIVAAIAQDVLHEMQSNPQP